MPRDEWARIGEIIPAHGGTASVDASCGLVLVLMDDDGFAELTTDEARALAALLTRAADAADTIRGTPTPGEPIMGRVVRIGDDDAA